MRIAIMAVPSVQMLDVAGPMDVFLEANNQVGDPNAYSVQIVAPPPAGFALDADPRTIAKPFDAP